MTELIRLHEALARVVVVDRDFVDVLTDITQVARASMPGTEAASITLIRGERPYTAAYDGHLALEADELQYQRGYGPCVDAGRAGQVFVVDDMRHEGRWPDYAQHAAAAGVGSSLSVPLPFQASTIGALNSYATEPHAFSEEDVALGEEIAAWVALAVANAEAAGRTVQELAQMREAMQSRASIEQAKGVLMERHKLTADQAFTLLTRASQHANVKLRHVADELVRTGSLLGAVEREAG